MLRIPKVSTNECPVSLITPRILLLSSMVDDDHLAKEASGATMYGPDTGAWPGWWFDAVTAIEAERRKIESERLAAHG